MRCHQNGFTLIELAVILLIIAVCATVVFPKLDGDFLNQQRFLSSVNKIASISEYAHQQAVCGQLTYLLNFNIEKGTYWVTHQTPNSKVMPKDTSFLKGQLPEGVRFEGIEFQGVNANPQNVVTIEFNPQGWIDPVTIYIASSQGRKMSIVMNELSGCIETYKVNK